MEGLNGRLASEAPSSSSSDLYATDTPTDAPKDVPKDVPKDATGDPARGFAKVSKPGRASPPKENGLHAQLVGPDDDDSEVAMDLSDDAASNASADPGPAPTGMKRKLSDAEAVSNGVAHFAEAVAKKPKFSGLPSFAPGSHARYPAIAGLPTELWQQVFMHLPPAMLCRCLRVCKTFNLYLSGVKAAPAPKRVPTRAHLQDSEAIWINSRRICFPAMPRPLADFKELQMLQLLTQQWCQACRKPPVHRPVTSIFNAGPGVDGLRVIYPFGVRMCGKCLDGHTITDIELLRDPDFVSILRKGLPYAFRTSQLHTVPEFHVVRQPSGGLPAQLRPKKIHYIEHANNMIAEFNDIKALGHGAEEEWKKGLDSLGREAMNDALRWERWEDQLPLGSSLADVLREYDLSSFPHWKEQPRRTPSIAATSSSATTLAPISGPHPLPQPVHALGHSLPPQPHPLPETPGEMPGNGATASMHRATRNPQQVQAAQQARRADIERRCMELQPPLEPSVLQHIDAYQAAVMIPTPMTENAWTMLKPRILAQREDAELVEHQRNEQLAVLQATIPWPTHDTSARPAKEPYDREYEQNQEPLRKKLGEYAEDRINGHWRRGEMLDHETVPVFVSDIVSFVHQRYLLDKAAETLPTGESQPRLSKEIGSSQPVPKPFLSLDNMKWVYDNKIRSLTDHLRRETFVCRGCAEEKRPKWFGFEGLIQHYGAKHTVAFSKGNVVVHWQSAEWPDESPFHPDPSQWIKVDRKKAPSGRPRSSLPDGLAGPTQSNAIRPLLSEDPHFSAGHRATQSSRDGSYAAGYGPVHGHQGPSHGHLYAAQAPAPPRIDTTAQVQILSVDAREIWDILDGVNDMLGCVRLEVVMHHVIERFAEHFQSRPSLDLLTDALATNDLMRPIKNAQGLACKVCVASQIDGSADFQSYYQRIRNMRLYNPSSLTTHFKISHRPQGNLEWDWRAMIELPERALVAELMNTPGMDDQKLALVAKAFPDAFPSPLPKIGVVAEQPANPGPDSGLADRLLKRLTKQAQKPNGKKKKGNPSNANGRDSSEDAMPEPTEDEYDPRKPMLAQSSQQAISDPARFDTDVSRKIASTSAQSACAGPDSRPLALAPETLSALRNFSVDQGMSRGPPSRQDGKPSRSPSVGRAAHLEQPVAANAPPGVTPDISAIIASLTGQSQISHSTPTPMIAGHAQFRAPSQKHDVYVEPPQQHDPAGYARQEVRSSSSRYPPSATQSFPMSSHGAAAEPTQHPARHNGQDLLAALSRTPAESHPFTGRNEGQKMYGGRSGNTHRFEQNAHLPYVEASYPAPIQYHAPPPQGQSPPRVQYIYNGEHEPYARPPSVQARPLYYDHQTQNDPVRHNPYDGPPAQVRYHSEAGPLHYAAHPPQQERTVYVDEHGRRVELIPIDHAPQRVQYLPQQYEQAERAYAGPGGGALGGLAGPQAAGPYPASGAMAQGPAPMQYAPAPQQVYYEPPPHAHTSGGFRYVYEAGDERVGAPRR